ncbi:MAG: YaaL family protein [Oscillospiraceae bacterium]|nr:YaaL family protein [Oscillospiraceae bacterium]
MAGFARKAFGRPEEKDAQELLLEDIRAVCRQMDAARARFEMEQDEDLVESSIYELESLKARYRYLIKKAKRDKITDAPITAICPQEVSA